ncbi:hypothetical protein [Maridesulfovibrio sp.]|uniref:capsular polysaccharide export protein, LipB/KpsS family n=1 Tax=Maridesulfovibrio sp. TaxID=2795000 RepID=UPI002A18768C|nr:hypothetical protein [Maridesulfovibrio sp.]
MSKDEAVLLIGRGKLFEPYLQGMIDVFSKDYTVLVLEQNENIVYKGEYSRVNLPELPDTDSKDFWINLKQAEQKTGLNLFFSYSNYFYYGRLAQEANIDYSHYWHSREWIASQYMQSFNFMNAITSRYNLKFVFHDTIDLILLQMVEAMSCKLGFGFYHTLIKPGPFDNRVLLAYGIPRKSALFTKYINENISPTKEEKEVVDGIINTFCENKPALTYLKNSSQKIITLNELKRIPSRIKDFKFGFKRVINRLYLHRQAQDFSIDRAGKYILFFLSHQPEATTTSAAPKYADQWKIIEELAVHGPSDLNIVIKAHPFGYGWQGKNYFEKMLRLPNVMLAPISFPGKELIQNACAVLTINGSVGLEAFIYDVPAYTIGDAWYGVPGIIQELGDPLDILRHIDNPPIIGKEDKYMVLAAAYRASFEFFLDFSEDFADEKINSGRILANHILDNRDLYFGRPD